MSTATQPASPTPLPKLEPIREILRSAFREIRTRVAASEPSETVALLNLQLLELFPRGPGAGH